MLGYPGEGPSGANRKATRAQEEELRKQVQQESAVLEDVDTDDEWIDDMDNSSKSSLDTEVGAWQGDVAALKTSVWLAGTTGRFYRPRSAHRRTAGRRPPAASRRD
jgi:hypothetical protein